MLFSSDGNTAADLIDNAEILQGEIAVTVTGRSVIRDNFNRIRYRADRRLIGVFGLIFIDAALEHSGAVVIDVCIRSLPNGAVIPPQI